MSSHWSGGVIQVSSLTPNSDIHRMFGTKISTASSKTGAKFTVALILAYELTCHISKFQLLFSTYSGSIGGLFQYISFNSSAFTWLFFFCPCNKHAVLSFFFPLPGSSLAASLAVRVQRSMRSARCQALRSRLPTLWKARLTGRSP